MSYEREVGPTLDGTQPKRSGRFMQWGVAILAVAAVLLTIGFRQTLEELESDRVDAVPFFFLGIPLAALGLLLVVTAFTRLAANVEFLVTARRQGGAAPEWAPRGSNPQPTD